MPVAVLVHADSGAGPAIRRRLAADGYDVRPIPGASIDRATAGRMVADAAAGGIDLLVNNAPPFTSGSVLDGVSLFADALDVGLNGVFSACREAARAAIGAAQPLTIVNVISVLASVGLPNRAGEACASAGVLAATKALAAEWGPMGVRVTAVMVGPTDSWLDEGEEIERIPGVLPLGRTIAPDDVAAAVTAVAGSDLAAATGQAVIVDSGWLAHGWRRD
jgi:NAD(P)-dependent dehydrogenase (short-subunit alcohol dehydrogenase family)